jgi:Ca-activated chloride channel homolog
MRILFCLYLVAWSLVIAPQAQALPFRSDLNRGNDLYKKGDYSGAGQVYNKLLKERSDDQKARFNLGDSLYKAGKYQESQKVFESLTGEAAAKGLRQRSYYNLGNSLFKQEDYKGAVSAYEESLKLDPDDKEAQFNLELAKKMLAMPKQQRKQQQREQKKKEENQKKEQEKKQREQEKKEQQKKDQGQDKGQRQPQPKPGQMSKEDALRILKALEDKEKHQAKKLKAGQGKANVKDW